jgi:hypothetical protein
MHEYDIALKLSFAAERAFGACFKMDAYVPFSNGCAGPDSLKWIAANIIGVGPLTA